MNFEESLVVKGLMDEEEKYNQTSNYENNYGFKDDGSDIALALVILVGGFIALLVLDRLGIAPGEVWRFVKAVMFPSTWDIQTSAEIAHFERAAVLFFSIVGTFIGGVFLMGVFQAIANFFERMDFRVMIVFYLAFKVLSYLAGQLMALNIAVLFARTIWYLILAFFAWLG